jgi:hypothetical protein
MTLRLSGAKASLNLLVIKSAVRMISAQGCIAAGCRLMIVPFVFVRRIVSPLAGQTAPFA